MVTDTSEKRLEARIVRLLTDGVASVDSDREIGERHGRYGEPAKENEDD